LGGHLLGQGAIAEQGPDEGGQRQLAGASEGARVVGVARELPENLRSAGDQTSRAAKTGQIHSIQKVINGNLVKENLMNNIK